MSQMLEKHVSYQRGPKSVNMINRNSSTIISTPSENVLPGHNTLRDNNVEILKYLTQLKEQRDELVILIKKQEIEKKQLKTEMDLLKYKYKLVTKSLNQRIMTRTRYDQTIQEAEELFKKLVISSDTLLGAVRKDVDALEETINKKVGTDISALATMKGSTIPYNESSDSERGKIIKPQRYTIPQLPSSEIYLPSAMDCVFQPQKDSNVTLEKKSTRSMQKQSNTLEPGVDICGILRVESNDYNTRL